MLAQLGEVVFELEKSPGTIQETAKWEYAEHKVLDSKPHLQKMGQALLQFSITIRVSISFGYNPQEMINALKTEADKTTALPFILGNGKVLGEFVIEEIQSSWDRMDNRGNILAAGLSLRIKEYR